MDNNDRTLEIFAKTEIEGLSLTDGVARFGGNHKIYLKILKTFVDNIDPHLDALAELTRDGLEAYGIRVHGVKGSCYGISANKEGDMAKELEIAAKEGNYEKVSANNALFIAAVNELKNKLQALFDEIEGGVSGVIRKPVPDKAILAAIMQASRMFDVEKMQYALAELEKYEYEVGGDLVKWLGEQMITFSYDKIEERLASILE